VIKSLVNAGGYKNVVGLNSSLGKDVIPRVAGSFATQPITDITEICVFIHQLRHKTLIFVPLTQEMPSQK
jgi:electron transfer flavoprotein alpha subunit